MSISDWAANLSLETIVSEQDVRTRIAVPLLEFLGYPENYYANEFSIYSFSGRTKNKPKKVDILCFESEDWANNQSFESRSWVKQHSLLSFELKKPGENLENAEGQAEFYSMNARTPYYMVTNGIQIKILKMKEFTADRVIYDGLVSDLPKRWTDINSNISFCSIKKLKKSIAEVEKKKIFLDYCAINSTQYAKQYQWYWEQEAHKKDETSVIHPKDFAKLNGKFLLTGEAGTGKTTFMHQIFIEECRKYLAGQSERIPVLLSAKFWKRGFVGLHEGVFSELQNFIPSMTIEIVRDEIRNGTILLLVDGLDETFIDRDLLIHEIIGIKCDWIISSRENVVESELNGVDRYMLSLLSFDKIVEISSNILKADMYSEINKLPDNLKKNLEVPIYLNMYLMYKTENRDSVLPHNIADLYQSFTSYLLKKYPNMKGNSDGENIPLDSFQSILSKFAFKTYESENINITNLIRETHPEKVSQIYQIFLQSGLIFETSGGCEFQQYSMKEYYYARFILENEFEVLDHFLNTKVENPKYEEIILNLLRISQKESIQDKILDILRENNLPLYIKSLKQRYNFSAVFEENKDKEFFFKFFEKIRSNYEELLEQYFQKIKKSIIPFELVDANSIRNMSVGLDCSVDMLNNTFSIKLKAINVSEVRKIKLEWNDTPPSMSIEREGKMIPISFGILRSSNGFFTYDLDALGQGLDYAREISIDMLYHNIKLAIENDGLIEYETPIMITYYIEDCLKAVSPLKINKDGEAKTYSLSLREQKIEELLDISKGLSKYTIVGKRDKIVSFGMLWALLYVNKDSLNLDFASLLFPKMPPQPLYPENSVKNYYSDQQIIEWIVNYYKYGQMAYREYVQKLLPELSKFLGLFQIGPVQYNIEIKLPNRDNGNLWSDGYVGITFHLKEKIEESDPQYTLVQEETGIQIDPAYFDVVRREAKLLGRKVSTYLRSSLALSSIINEAKNPRSFVYEHLLAELKKIFEPSN